MLFLLVLNLLIEKQCVFLHQVAFEKILENITPHIYCTVIVADNRMVAYSNRAGTKLAG
jgi:hypothetical protein